MKELHPIHCHYRALYVNNPKQLLRSRCLVRNLLRLHLPSTSPRRLENAEMMCA